MQEYSGHSSKSSRMLSTLVFAVKTLVLVEGTISECLRLSQ